MKTQKNIVNLVEVITAAAENNTIDLTAVPYTRIGSKAVQKTAVIGESEKEALANAVANAKTLQDLKKAAEEAEALEKSHKEIPFSGNYAEASLIGMAFNESRANVSIMVRISGTVTLPEERPDGLPDELETSIVRNYAVIRDGVLNIRNLKLKVSQHTADLLKAQGYTDTADTSVALDLTALPMAEPGQTFERHFLDVIDTLKGKARTKVLKRWLENSSSGSGSDSLYQGYGEYNGNFLAALGITDKGFFPKTEGVAAGTEYGFTELLDKVKGLSTVPSYNAFAKKLAEGKKLNTLEAEMKALDERCRTLAETDILALLKQEQEKLAECGKRIAGDRIAWITGDVDGACKTSTVTQNGETYICTLEKREMVTVI